MEHQSETMAEDATRPEGKEPKDSRNEKNWVKDNVGYRGDDPILWDKWEESKTRPYSTKKQMRKRGEAVKQKQRLDN